MEKRPIAYQLYSAREEAAKNLSGVLGEIAAMGYDGVEFAGFFGIPPEEIDALLARYNLQAISSHVPLAQIEADMYGVISYHRKIGCKHIVLPYLDEETRPGTPGFARVLRVIYRFGALCRDAGIRLLYHNHDFEFVQLSGQYGLDFLYEAVPADLLQSELDVCWIQYTGEDPAAYLRKYAGRCPVVHLKDYVGTKGEKAPYALIGKDEDEDHTTGVQFEFRPLGHGSIDVKGIVEAGIQSGAEWFVVEQDLSVGHTPLEAAKMSIDTLKQLGVTGK